MWGKQICPTCRQACTNVQVLEEKRQPEAEPAMLPVGVQRCVTCNILVEHAGEGCSEVTCRCGVIFFLQISPLAAKEAAKRERDQNIRRAIFRARYGYPHFDSDSQEAQNITPTQLKRVGRLMRELNN